MPSLPLLVAPLLLSLQAPFGPLPVSAAGAPPEPAGPPAVHLVRVRGEGVLRRLLRAGLDVAAPSPDGGYEVVATDADLALLRERGFDHDVAIRDLAAHYAARLAEGAAEGTPPLGSGLVPPFGAGSMGGYYTLAEVLSVLDQLRATYPAQISARTSIGQTIEGRDIWAVKISDAPDVEENEPEARFDSLHHAREPEGMQATLWFMLFLLEGYGSDPLATYLVDQRELWFVPVVNPDGYALNESTNPGGGGMWRKNLRDNGDGTVGVDLNRNYPFQWGYDDFGSSPSSGAPTYRGSAPMSEPEIQAMVAFFGARDFRTSLSTHTFSNVWLYPFAYDAVCPADDAVFAEISELATRDSGYEYGATAKFFTFANGSTFDYEYGVIGTLGWSPEIGGSSDGFWPPTARIVPLAEENLVGFQATALAAGAWVRLLSSALVEGSGDGDGHFEPNETVELTSSVRNSGLDGTATAVLVSLSTTSPYATATVAQHDFGTLAAFSEDDNGTAPLELSIDAGAPAGTRVPWTLELAYEGWTQSFEGALIVGEPIDLVVDDVETDAGWTAGLPGDTATSGLWVRGDPIGTSSGGEPANPEDDDTPGAGVDCFMTGNGGGSAGNDDVDGGRTTLISPRLDLSGLGSATISYARWFADLTVADDALEVSITDNGGFSWMPLETVAGNQNAWVQATFAVEDFASQTSFVQLRFIASDELDGSIVEAAVDSLRVTIFDELPRLNVYGPRQLGAPVVFNISGPAGARWYLLRSRQPPAEAPPQTFGAARLLAPVELLNGVLPPERVAHVPGRLPSRPSFAGTTVYYRAAVVSAGTVQVSNVVPVSLP